MVWSVSTAKIFDRCQRQWFFKQHFANARSKDEARRKAYLLGKLQSVSSWRGSVVDQVLSFEVIGRGETVSEAKTLASAMTRFDRQLAVARRHPIPEPGFKPSACGDDFAAFERYLSNLQFKGKALKLARNAERTERKQFTVPDLEFGRGRWLTVRGTSGATAASLDDLGRRRTGLLRDSAAGFPQTRVRMLD